VLALGELMALVDEVTARLPQLAEAAEAATTRGTAATNASRTVRVTAASGVVSAVDFDPHWLQSADLQHIAAGIQEALAAAVRDAARVRQEALDSVPGLQRVRRLTASPEALLREIGLLK
jgi:DNA-binding protein YbaB